MGRKKKNDFGLILQRRDPFEQVSGFLYPTDSISISTYQKMATEDATIAACLEFVTLSALSRLGEYHHHNEVIQEFVNLNFELLEGSFFDTCKHLLSCLWSGFSVAEIVTEERDGFIWLHSLPMIPADTVYLHLCDDTNSLEYGSVDKIIQNYAQINEVHIPINKLILMRNTYSGDPGGNPYGCSRLKAIYSAYLAKIEAEKQWTTVLTRYGEPLIKYKISDGEQMVKNSSGTLVKKYERALSQIKTFKSCGGWVYEEGNELELVYPPDKIGQCFESISAYWNRLIMRGLLIPSLLFENGSTGSYALGSEHFALFQIGLDVLIKNLTETLLEQVVRPLITMNFGIQDSWGEFLIRESREEMQSWAALFQSMSNAGAINFNDINDINRIREHLQLPLLETMPISKEQAEQQNTTERVFENPNVSKED